MAITPQQARQELAKRELQKRRAVAEPRKQGILGQAKEATLGALETVRPALEFASTPFEIVGEAARGVVEMNNNPDGFRAPSIVQRFMPSTKTAEPPAFVFDTANKLIRAGTGAISSIGTEKSAIEGAREAYNAPRGIMGPIEDTALGLLAGKIAPRTVSAPMDASIGAIKSTIGASKGLTKWAGKKAITASLGPSAEAQSARFKNPEAFKAAPMEGEIADRIAQTANQLSNKIGEADTVAWKTLRKSYDPSEGAVSKAEILSLIKKTRKDLAVHGGGTVGRASKGALKTLKEIEDDVLGVGKNVRGLMKKPGAKTESLEIGGTDVLRTEAIQKNTYLPEATVKGIIQKLDENINWADDTLKPVNDALQGTRVGLDSRLKGQNGAYRQAMEPVAEMVDTLTGLKKKLSLSRVRGEGFAPSDTTIGKVKAIGKREMPETGRTLAGARKATGHDIESEARTARLKSEFSGGTDKSRGSRRTLLGAITGEVVGSGLGLPNTIGGFLGAGTGAAADFYGGSAAGRLIDVLSKGNTKVDELFGGVKHAAQKTQVEALLELLKRNASAISGLRSAYLP